jgi:hypothetical protein
MHHGETESFGDPSFGNPPGQVGGLALAIGHGAGYAKASSAYRRAMFAEKPFDDLF